LPIGWRSDQNSSFIIAPSPVQTINTINIRFLKTNHSISVNEPIYKIPALGDHDILIALPGAGDELAG
jgi:hypothetical protein